MIVFEAAELVADAAVQPSPHGRTSGSKLAIVFLN
jgi:hypothetical protein